MRTERFLREIRIAAHLTHPHIVSVHDSGEAAGCVYYVMPYVEGESLRQRLEREGPLPLADTLRIARQVADALAFAHERNIVHRDIKPENILLCGGHAVVADFGIARAVSAAGGPRLTKGGRTVGTPSYMSPEQATGQADLDARCDVYSLGCVVYEMLAGHPPFTGRSLEEVLMRHQLDPVPSLHTARPVVPEAIDRAVRKALAKAPADRFTSMATFAGALTGGRFTPSLDRRPAISSWWWGTLRRIVDWTRGHP
jgi:serine/threonine-protein kinase